MVDPNPLVNSGGIATLRAAGIHVDVIDGDEAQQAHDLTRDFVAHITRTNQETTSSQSPQAPWGGALAHEAEIAAQIVQTAARLCVSLEQRMRSQETTAAQANSLGVTVSADAMKQGIGVRKQDETPLTAADLAIQAVASLVLSGRMPMDGFMAEEDAEEITRDALLADTVLQLVQVHGCFVAYV
jgi:hypothetical protein